MSSSHDLSFPKISNKDSKTSAWVCLRLPTWWHSSVSIAFSWSCARTATTHSISKGKQPNMYVEGCCLLDRTEIAYMKRTPVRDPESGRWTLSQLLVQRYWRTETVKYSTVVCAGTCFLIPDPERPTVYHLWYWHDTWSLCVSTLTRHHLIIVRWLPNTHWRTEEQRITKQQAMEYCV